MRRPRDPRRVLKDFGRRVAELREARGWTQEKMAERAGWSIKYVQRIEGGRANLTIKSLVQLGKLLGVDPQSLMEPPRSRDVRTGRPPKSSQAT